MVLCNDSWLYSGIITGNASSDPNGVLVIEPKLTFCKGSALLAVAYLVPPQAAFK